MPAIARTAEFKNQTFKRVVLYVFQKQLSLAVAIQIIGKNFPTKVGNPKKVERLTRALTTYQSQYNNGKLTYQEMRIVPVPAPGKKVYLKGLEPKRTSKPTAEKAITKKTFKSTSISGKPKPAKVSKPAKKKSAAKPAKTTEPEVIDLTD